MRSVLLGAKYLALDTSSNQITLANIQQALSGLQAIDNENYKLLSRLAKSSDDINRTELFTPEILEAVAAKPRLPYDNDVLALLMELKVLGIDASTKVSEIFCDMSERKGSYQSIIAGISEIQALLKTQIYDQDEAVEAVSDAVMKMAWSEKSNRPRAIFSFLGPPATGKTYLAELIGQGIQGYKLRSFDMTQYTSEKEGFALVGLRKGFESAGEGQLTSFVKQNPKSIIIFDEIEKSHTRVQTSLLRLLSAGYLKDEFSGDDIDFRETIVVFTSNLGSNLYSNRSFTAQTEESPHRARETLLQVIRQETKIESGHTVSAIPPELMSRLSQGSVVLFKRLSLSGLSKIATKLLSDESKAFQSKLGLSVEFTDLDQLVRLLVLGFAPNFDTRELKARVGDYVYDPITDYLIKHPDVLVNKIKIQLDQDTRAFLEDLDLVSLPNQLAAKHQRIFFEQHVNQIDGQLHLTYVNARIEKLAKEDDFSDASGIQVDLPDVSFKQIAGHHTIKARLQEVVQLLKRSDYLAEQGIAPPKGMLLYGVPGTGKTLLAKAFAHEADLPFLACSGNDLLNEEFIRTLFTRAREYAPAIIFIDEIDALPKRGVAGPHADALVNRLLVEIDGFNNNGDDIFIIAATNRKELIDPAVLRSGRIDLHHEVPQLDKDARRWFIEQMLEKPIFDSTIKIDQIVLLTAGLSGADLQKISRETILFALRENLESINENTLLEQVNILKYGHPLNLEDCKEQLEETAYHEAAHAVISRVLLPERRIEQITVIARSDFLGMVSYDNEQNHDYTRDFLFNLTCVALAGRAAQVKQFGSKGLDSGASGDLKQAMHYAWLAIAQWGMDEALYNISIQALQEHTSTLVYQETVEARICAWMKQATEETDHLLEKNWKKISAVAEQVLLEEVLDEQTLITLMENN